jgi:hypothetical protein
MGRELVVCCECRQPVMLRGSLSGLVRPHFAHYKVTEGKIEDAVPCDSRVSGGSKEYIKGEQKKHKTYGLGYLIRRFELYQSIAMWRHDPKFLCFAYFREGVEIDAFNNPGEKSLVKSWIDPTGDNLVLRVADPKRLTHGWYKSDKDIEAKALSGDEDLLKEAISQYQAKEEIRFIKNQTLFRTSLRTDGQTRAFLDSIFTQEVFDSFWDSDWRDAIEAAEKDGATLEVIEKGRTIELASNLFRYLCSRSSERNRFSVLLSSVMPHGISAVTFCSNELGRGKDRHEHYVGFPNIRGWYRVVAEKAAAEVREKGFASCTELLHLSAVLLLCSAYGNPVDHNSLGSFLLADLLEVCKSEDGTSVSTKLVSQMIYMTKSLVKLMLERLPYKSVFEDVLYRPEEIEKHYHFTNSNDGFIYLGHDQALDHIWHKPSVKIGKSIDPERRGRQLAGQCLPRALRIHRVWYVSDMRQAEQVVFQNLQRKRARNNREIFHLQLSEAAGRIDSILRRTNLLEVG